MPSLFQGRNSVAKQSSSAAAQFLTHNCRTNGRGGRGRAIYHLRAIVHLKKRATVRPGHIRAPGSAFPPSQERESAQPLSGHNASSPCERMASFCGSSPPCTTRIATQNGARWKWRRRRDVARARARGAVGKCARSGYGLSLSKSGSRSEERIYALLVKEWTLWCALGSVNMG